VGFNAEGEGDGWAFEAVPGDAAGFRVVARLAFARVSVALAL